MKKNIFLLSLLFQTSSLFCCKAEGSALRRVDLDTHMTALAALLSIPRQSEDNSRRLHKHASGFLTSALVRPSGDHCTISHPMLSKGTTFSVVCTPYSPSDTPPYMKDIKEIRDHAASSAPIFEFYTQRTDILVGNAIHVINSGSKKTSKAFLSPRIAPSSKEINLCINANPYQKNAAVYTIGAIPVQKATDTTLAGFAADIKIQDESTKEALLVPAPPFPESTIIAEVSRQEGSPDDTYQIVRVWKL